MPNKDKLSPKFILNKFKKEKYSGYDNNPNINSSINSNSSIVDNIISKITDLNRLISVTPIDNNSINDLYGDSLDSKKLANYLELNIKLANDIIDLFIHTSSCQISDAISQVRLSICDNDSHNNSNNNNNNPNPNNNNHNHNNNYNNIIDININNGDGIDANISSLKSVNNKKTFGRVVTGKTTSDDWGTSLLVIDSAEKGDIIFIDGGMDTGSNTIPAAIWGELTSSFSKKKGLAGTVIYGSCRDLDFLADFDYPVYSCFTVANAGKPNGLGDVNCDIIISENGTNYKVSYGDFIFADINGVVVIPKEIFMDVISKTLDIKIKELNIINQLNNGKSLSEIVGLR
ncbi:MAG: RraA family protein [Methanobacteriaceae archaeon]